MRVLERCFLFFILFYFCFLLFCPRPRRVVIGASDSRAITSNPQIRALNSICFSGLRKLRTRILGSGIPRSLQ
jgi:hypothetical protein